MENIITTWEELEATVLSAGMLPYFRNKIPGFSVEENVPENILWDITSGPWDWKGSVTRNMKVAYGKFFNGRAGYISVDCLPDFINVRRDKFPLHPGTEEARIYDILVQNESLLSKELKNRAGYLLPRKPRKSANPFENMPEIGSKQTVKLTDSRFETALTRLQVGGYVVIADFEYLYDRQGNRYGWGVARYTTPEAFYDITTPDCPPYESFRRLCRRLRGVLPDASPVAIANFIHK